MGSPVCHACIGTVISSGSRRGGPVPRPHRVSCSGLEGKTGRGATRAKPSRGHARAQELRSQRLSALGSVSDASLTPGEQNTGLSKADYDLFVRFFRQASPYIEGHRGRTFVIAIPGEVVDRPDYLDRLMEDVMLLHGLGVRLVLVVGARLKIDEAVRAGGNEPQYVRGYRVTDDVAMNAAVAAAGVARMTVEARLSRAPSVTMLRELRTTRNSRAPRFTTASGNYVAAKRKGVVDGIDYQHTGSVRFVQSEAVTRQLEDGNIVLLSNLGYSASGEPLNCDCYSVAVRAAIDLSADKLVVVSPPDGDPFMDTLTNGQGNWLPVHEAEKLLLDRSQKAFHIARDDLDFDTWYELGLPMPLLAACMVCKSGVKRAHVINASIDGGLLLELYSTDGVGYMISSDFYEGIRAATTGDVSNIFNLLKPMVEKGVMVHRTHETIAEEISHFTVLERDNELLACAYVRPLGTSEETGQTVCELGAFCVHPDYRGGGKGDSLLQYLEEKERSRSEVMVLLTTRTADWFIQRGFKAAGAAHSSGVIPEGRRKEIDVSRNSQLYFKKL